MDVAPKNVSGLQFSPSSEKHRDNFSICCLVNQLQLSNQDNGCKIQCVECVSGEMVSHCKSDSEQSNSIFP